MTKEEKQDYLKEFGEYVRYLRQKKGWSQEELATRCGYTSDTRKSTIHKIEAGKSDLPASKIRTLATALGISPVDLIDPPSEARDEMMVCELFERCHGKEQFHGMDLSELSGKKKAEHAAAVLGNFRILNDIVHQYPGK